MALHRACAATLLIAATAWVPARAQQVLPRPLPEPPPQLTPQAPRQLPPAPPPLAPGAPPQVATPQPPVSSIGTARMLADRTIELDLSKEPHIGVARSPGELGYGQVDIETTNPHYGELLQHLGGLRPGEEKPVAPWRADETWHCAFDPDRGPCPLNHSLDRTAAASPR